MLEIFTNFCVSKKNFVFQNVFEDFENIMKRDKNRKFSKNKR